MILDDDHANPGVGLHRTHLFARRRKRQRKDTSTRLSWGVRHAAAELFRNAPDNVEPKTGARTGMACSKTLKEPFTTLRRNAEPIVFDDDLNRFA